MLPTTPRPSRRSTPRLPVRAAFLLALALLTASARGQEQDRQPPPPPDPAVAAVQEALRAAGEGELEAAVARLEAIREQEEGELPEFFLATLGALYVEAGRAEEGLEILAPLAAGENAGAAVLYNAARAALALGRGAEGIEYLERSVALQPNTPAARELGLIYGVSGRYREAYRLLRPWVDAHPDDEEVRRAAALCAVQLRRVPEAEELLSTLPQTDPATGLLWGRLLLLKGEPHAALAILQPLLSDAPEELASDLRRSLAEAYLEVGESDRAVEVLEGTTGEEPRSTLLLARALYQAGELEGALATLGPFAETLIEVGIDPEHPDRPLASEIVREYGRWLVNAGRNEEALPYLRLATEADPGEKEAWKALGQALAATGSREEAQEALARFQELAREEGSETARVNRARLEREDPTAGEIERAQRLVREDRPEEALEVLRAERELDPDDLRPWLLESRVLLVLGRNAQALELAEEIVARAPENPDAHYQRGTAHLAREDFGAAEADLRRALELAPGHVPALNDLAVLLILEGDRDEARALLERVLELRPGDAQATATLERLDGS